MVKTVLHWFFEKLLSIVPVNSIGVRIPKIQGLYL